jgi:hypothetical protein
MVSDTSGFPPERMKPPMIAKRSTSLRIECNREGNFYRANAHMD